MFQFIIYYSICVGTNFKEKKWNTFSPMVQKLLIIPTCGIHINN